MSLDPESFLVLVGLLLGLAMGVLLQRTHWCTMGAIADWTLFGSRRRLRVWALAAAIAVIGAQALAAAGLVELSDSIYLANTVPLFAILPGGFAFGFGMVLTGGCVSRSMARAGSGSLRSLVVLLAVALSAQATMSGVLAPVAAALRDLAAPELAAPGLVDLLGEMIGMPAAQAGIIAAAAVGGPVLLWALADPALRRPGNELIAGLGLGLLVIAGWAATGLAASDPFADLRPASLAYVGPTARALVWLIAGDGTLPTFGPALALGTLSGAFVAARLTGSFRFEGFVDATDLHRHLVGALLMGTGGTLALGCTVGQGLSGLSTLSFSSLLAVTGIILGARRALRWLETGRLLPAPLRRIASLFPRMRFHSQPGDSA